MIPFVPPRGRRTPEERATELVMLSRVAASSDFRGIADLVDRGAQMVFNHCGSARDIGEVLKVDESAIRRGIKRLDRGQPVGVQGRPRALVPTAFSKVQNWLQVRTIQNDFPTSTAIAEQV